MSAITMPLKEAVGQGHINSRIMSLKDNTEVGVNVQLLQARPGCYQTQDRPRGVQNRPLNRHPSPFTKSRLDK